MQTMSIPELIIGFFKAIFYVFYYSGYGVIGVIRYVLIDVLMSLMRGPTEEVHEEPPVHGDQFMVKALTDSPSEDISTSAAITDTSKDESGKMELVTQSSVAGVERTGENATEEGSTEQTEQKTGESEPPMSLVSCSIYLFIYLFIIRDPKSHKIINYVSHILYAFKFTHMRLRVSDLYEIKLLHF